MTTWRFVEVNLQHPIDGRIRIAGQLYVNAKPTEKHVYSRQRARDAMAKHMVGSQCDPGWVRATLQHIDQLRYLPEHNHDFPTVVLCQCGKHATLLNADGVPLQGWPGYSRQVLHQRCRNASVYDVPERYRVNMIGHVGELGLPWESPLDLLASTVSHQDWVTTNWCNLR